MFTSGNQQLKIYC